MFTGITYAQVVQTNNIVVFKKEKKKGTVIICMDKTTIGLTSNKIIIQIQLHQINK